VLSVQPDVMTPLVRHRRDGYYFYAYSSDAWPDSDRDWLRSECEWVGHLSPEASAGKLVSVVNRLRTETNAHVLIFNMSSVVPGESVHIHDPATESLSTRIRRFNLALVGVAEETGISLVDVDSIIARAGADRVKLDAVHFTPEGLRLVAEETVRVMAELGCFDGNANPIGDRE